MSEGVTYRVTVAGREFEVTVAERPEGLSVAIGDAPVPAAWVERAPHTGTLRLGEARTEVLLAPAGHDWQVVLRGYQAVAQVVEARALRLAATLPRRALPTGRVEVRAPMPGRVVAVRAVVGAVVPRGAVVAILEAMKMENALPAPQPGRVAAVHVREGETVEHGALLLVLEPPEPAGAGPAAPEPEDDPR
jgi:biotin carboxyl carrier protein